MRPGHPRLVAALASVAFLLTATATAMGSYLIRPDDVRQWTSEMLLAVSAGFVTGLIVFVVVNLGHERVLDYAAETLGRQNRIAELVALARVDHAEALRSFRLLAEMGALADGSLRNRCLAGADLSGLSLDGADLTGADLSGCCLRETTFVGAHVDGVRFDGADLTDAFVEFASAEGAEFRGAKLPR